MGFSACLFKENMVKVRSGFGMNRFGREVAQIMYTYVSKCKNNKNKKQNKTVSVLGLM
jgi:hypothetical protein